MAGVGLLFVNIFIDILVTCSTRQADFDELFRILKFRFFLRYFGTFIMGIFRDNYPHFPTFLRSGQFSGIFTCNLGKHHSMAGFTYAS